MRERIVRELRDAAPLSEADRRRWTELRDRLGEIAISTIDAFCLSLLREFPLEADVDPGFEMADETEVPRLVEESLDQSLRIFTGLARREPDVALVLAQLGLSRTREGLAALLDRRLVAWGALESIPGRRAGRPDVGNRLPPGACRNPGRAADGAGQVCPGCSRMGRPAIRASRSSCASSAASTRSRRCPTRRSAASSTALPRISSPARGSRAPATRFTPTRRSTTHQPTHRGGTARP